jgi:hypothetical protein
MRQIVTSVLMVAMCIGSMASVIWALNFGGSAWQAALAAQNAAMEALQIGKMRAT